MKPTETMQRVSITVRGRVQGVFFRASTRNEARRLGVRGWVRNLADGGVEIAAEGTTEALELLLGWCRRGGPPGARVDAVEARWAGATGELEPFSVRY